MVTLLLGIALVALAAGLAPTDRRDLSVGGALAGVALAVRLTLGPWGPFHVNGQGPFWILGAVSSPEILRSYGTGYAAIFGPIGRAFPGAPDTAIFATNAVLSALFPPIAFALARSVGVARERAAIVAAVAVLDPVAIRFGATESYLPILIALDAATQLSLVRAVASWTSGSRGRSAAWLGAAMCLACTSAEIHPLALVNAALSPLIVTAASGESRVRRGLSFLVLTAACVAAGAFAGILLGDVPFGEALHSRTGQHAWDAHAAVPLAFTLLVAFFALRRIPAGARRILPSALAHVLAALGTMSGFSQSRLWLHAYLHLYGLVPLVLVSALLPELGVLRRRPAVASALGVFALLGASAACPVVWQRTTEQEEYRWLRGVLGSLPPSSRVAFVQSAERSVMFIPLYDSRRLVRLHAGDPGSVGRLAGDDSAYYIHTSLCETAPGRAACDSVESALRLEAESEATFPAKPSYDGLPYVESRVHDVVFRIRNR
jgi:hypothetical protein